MPESNTNITYPKEQTGGLIQSPGLDSKGKPQYRSIADDGMARNVINTVMVANRNRQIVNSRILAKYNAERPYDSSKLEAEGLGWRQNFTTKPLPTMIEKVAPRFVEAVNGLKFLTNSSLPSKFTNATEKTEKFREDVTETLRSHKGWTQLIEDIAFENGMFGHAVPAWLDEWTWFPKLFKQDEHFLHDGTKQTTSFCQVAVFKEVYMPHELFDKIKDREAAAAAGWNIQDTIEQINMASPGQIRDRLNIGGTLESWYQNAVREMVIGTSYMSGANIIVVYTLLAVEVTGKVSHYRLAGTELKEIFSRDDRFDSMADCMTFFSYQKGNGTMHGSKGIGRDIYELAGMIDRTRNEAVDRLMLSGKTMVQGNARNINKFKMHVIGSMCILPEGWNVLSTKIESNVEEFIKLDAYFQSLVDQLIGSVSPPNPAQGQGEAFRSPQAWQLLASREEEGKDAKISRFMGQFTEMVQTMQRKLCNRDTNEDDAKEFQKKVKEYLTDEELDAIANSPVAETIRDLTPMERQMIALVASEKKGNPLYNQRQLEVEDLNSRIGKEFCDRVLLPDNDPTEKAEQMRLQQFECDLLTKGQPVPVSPRDAHVIHLQVLVPITQTVAQALGQGHVDTSVLEVHLAHMKEHLNRAMEAGVPKQQLADAESVLKNADKALVQLKQLDQQAAQLRQQSDQHDQQSQALLQQAPSAPPA